MDLSEISPELLSHIPAGIPPAGTIPNFENPQTISRPVIVLSILCLSVMVLIASLRIYSRVWITRSFGWDDAACLLAMMGTIAYTLETIHGLGIAGKHMWDTPVSAYTTTRIQMFVVGLEMFYGPTVFFVKLAFFLFYLRLFSPNIGARWFVYFGIAAIIINSAGLTIAFGVLCLPSPHQTWQEALFSSKCQKAQRLCYISGVFNVVSDFYIMLLPLPVISKLQLSRKKKIGISAVFMTGFLACISSILALYYRIQIVRQSDVTWWLGFAILLTAIELNIGIICGSMPHTISLIRHNKLHITYLAFLKKVGSSLRHPRSSQFEEEPIAAQPSILDKPKLKTDILGSAAVADGKFWKPGAFKVTVSDPDPDSTSHVGATGVDESRTV